MSDPFMPPPPAPNHTSSDGTAKNDTIKSEPDTEPVVHREPIDIEQPFKTLNAVPRIIEPWEQYRADVANYDEQVAEKMLDLMLNVRAWAEARPTFEDIKGETEVRKRLEEIEKREDIQEATRKKVMSFIDVVRAAIASLTGPGASTVP
ncbi:hypothetical protein CALVIDRAFT_600123 [Calocera viscosa TUFC12733]|uniref:Uncharacterized protein n=1 Tax=Calocera viscosa (strain TUFC12733) TaxID=1330018 RepID=A0A167K2L6_CALVF|nr:hypothetical protein CALVIDRAFT_600123 [Calocera viscosa TUFC12733]